MGFVLLLPSEESIALAIKGTCALDVEIKHLESFHQQKWLILEMEMTMSNVPRIAHTKGTV